MKAKKKNKKAASHPVENTLPFCSFCGKRSDAVVRMVSSPRHANPKSYICNECIVVCVSIFAYEPIPTIANKTAERDTGAAPERKGGE